MFHDGSTDGRTDGRTRVKAATRGRGEAAWLFARARALPPLSAKERARLPSFSISLL